MRLKLRLDKSETTYPPNRMHLRQRAFLVFSSFFLSTMRTYLFIPLTLAARVRLFFINTSSHPPSADLAAAVINARTRVRRTIRYVYPRAGWLAFKRQSSAKGFTSVLAVGPVDVNDVVPC